MHIRLKITVIILTSALLSTIGMSAFGSGWSGRQVTERITHRNEGIVFAIGLYGPWNNPDNCDVASVVVLSADLVSESFYDETYAILLGAHLTGREINAFLSGCKKIGSSTFPVLTKIAIY